ncbi:MAG: AAA family ATPase [Bacteroides sp.]|nr:AAA family ATPase [Bacteroides sp.]
MEVNTELELAWQCIEHTDSHLFLTGKAGTGKTTFLRKLKNKSPKRMIVVAPTGIAAINAGGVTMHSFFQLSFGPYIPENSFIDQRKIYRFGKDKINIIRSLDLLVIDEISMVRADLLDSVDEVLRRYRDRNKPFGGVQLLMIGDLQQLAPVVKDSEWSLLSKYYDTPYFFGSRALKETEYITIQLEKVYRQSDSTFISLLNKIRTNQIDYTVLSELNKRYIPNFKPTEEGYIRLTTHNAQAQRINDAQLALLAGKTYIYQARIEGAFPETSYPADARLSIKPGAQIMFIKNDTGSDVFGNKRYYNGKIGVINRIYGDKIVVQGNGDTNEFILEKEEWANTKYTLNEETGEIREEIEGTFHQYPIRLAWAITIHKSQGLTFEKAIIDANASFAHGQVYVALSRCKTLEGMVLESPLSPQSIICDERISEFTHEVENSVPDPAKLKDLQKQYFYRLLCEQFDYSSINKHLSYLLRLLEEHYTKLYPILVNGYREGYSFFKKDIEEVAIKFRNQYTSLFLSSENYLQDQVLRERIRAGASYFQDKTRVLLENTIRRSIPDSDNKELRKRLKETYTTLYELIRVKIGTLSKTADEGFTISIYLGEKAHILIALTTQEKLKPVRVSKTARIKDKEKEKVKVEVPADILHPVLYAQLIKWRNAEAAKTRLPVYTVLQQKAILGVVNLLPVTKDELLRIPFLGKKTVEKYGDELLSMVVQYVKQHKTEQ